MKRILPLLVGIGCGVIGLLDFFLPNPEIDALGTVLVEGVTILAAFALLLGLLNLLSVHVKRLAGHGPRRGLSLLLILSLLTSLAVGVFLPASATLQWMFTYFYVPLQSSMTGLLAFFS
ncbi:MAG: hypothetical protein H5T69_17315, partial [Chloroflexi bacterium]|nr:hypothetical protein [Chloroflexota bacterium]